ncbi:MAG: matrixin family metalloprotease [Candidatus Gastranaerophilales bacterium]|nr:matrixin family metalloprotease [Candidatus Gastranaerophilales bacterium]
MPDLKRFFFIIYLISFFLILNQQYSNANNAVPLNYNEYNILSNIEKQIYNKEYSQENFYPRLERLEKSVLNSVYTDSIYDRLNRLQDILSVSKSLKQNNNRDVILNLLENRYFGFNYKEDSLDVRLARLEECLFGKSTIGTTSFRFENLAKQMPANNQQNSVQQPPENSKKVKDWKEYTSFADINLNNSEIDYFSSIQKLNGRNLFKWNNFPVLVYIYPESDNLVKKAKKSVQIWSEYIQIDLTNNLQDANIVISWKKNYPYITKPDKSLNDEHILYNKDEKTKMYIYCGKYKDSVYLDKLLTHQIGHSLGLWGHSNNKTDIMYPFKEFKNDINYRELNNNIPDITVNSAPYRPSTRDINTLLRVYHL